MTALRRYGNRLLVLAALILLLLVSGVFGKEAKRNDFKPVVIKLATLAPSGSPWHEILQDMAAEWSEVSGGKVSLRIYPGGVAGDEADMVRKMRIGQLHAAAITNNGLSRIAPEIGALTIPMAVDSWEALDRVRSALEARLRTLFEEKGFFILSWGDAGWVRFFVPSDNPSVEAVRKAKLFVWSGDDRAVEVWKSARFNVVPLAATDILPGLQTGMIEAFNTTPIIALANQWFPFTPYMIDMPWAPLVGATVISTRKWNRIPPELQARLQEVAQKAGARMRAEVRRMEAQAIQEMQKRGLKVLRPTPEQVAQWRSVMRQTYARIRGAIVPASWFDAALHAVASGQSSAAGL